MFVSIKEGSNGRWYWTLYAANNKAVATCAGGKHRGYATEKGCKEAFRNLHSDLWGTSIEEMKYKVTKPKPLVLK